MNSQNNSTQASHQFSIDQANVIRWTCFNFKLVFHSVKVHTFELAGKPVIVREDKPCRFRYMQPFKNWRGREIFTRMRWVARVVHNTRVEWTRVDRNKQTTFALSSIRREQAGHVKRLALFLTQAFNLLYSRFPCTLR